ARPPPGRLRRLRPDLGTILLDTSSLQFTSSVKEVKKRIFSRRLWHGGCFLLLAQTATPHSNRRPLAEETAMSTLTSSPRTVQGSLQANLVRHASKDRQPAPRPGNAGRPSFLVVLLRALGGVAA